jgi:hypothetical protein
VSIITFMPAARKGAHVIITAYGESGSGKTLSLLKIGRGLVGPKGRLAMIDTETGRGMIYADAISGGYDYGELTPPFTPERYIEAIDIAENELKADALIIDSGSLEWEGIGGVLEIAEDGRSAKGEALQGLVKWAKPKARHKKYVQRLLNSRMHLLIALRAKEKMVQVGGKIPIPPGAKAGDIISDGFVPIQDKRFIFETTVQLFLPVYKERDKLGIPIVEKCPGDLWTAFADGQKITERTGGQIADWVAGGEPVDHEFQAFKLVAEEKAAEGTEAFRSYWRSLPKSEPKDRLAPYMDNLRSIAADADEQAQAHPAPEPPAGETEAPHSANAQSGSSLKSTPSQADSFAATFGNADEAFCHNTLARALACTTLDETLALRQDELVKKRMSEIPQPMWRDLEVAIGKHESELRAKEIA